MRPTLALTAALALLTVGIAQNSQPLRIGIAFDIGGKNDRSFNQAAWQGAQRAQRELGIEVYDFEPSDGSQVGQGVRTFAEEGANLVIGVGFANQASVTTAARNYPNLKFAVVDDLPKGNNATGLVFREHEGSFIVGFIAGKTSSTGVVGFVGGMDIPLIHKFEAGYRAGVLAANPKARVVAQYVGTTPDAFNNPAKAKEIAVALKARGADIIYAAAGGSGNGVIDFVKQTKCVKRAELPRGVTFAAANPTASVPRSRDYNQRCSATDRPMFFIGVDSNQNYLGDTDNNPRTLNHGLTSMMKRVDVAVYNVIRDLAKGDRWRAGSREFALGNDGVGYALDEYNRALVPAALQRQIESIKRLVVSGTIKVPRER